MNAKITNDLWQNTDTNYRKQTNKIIAKVYFGQVTHRVEVNKRQVVAGNICHLTNDSDGQN